jgi:dihydroxyacetone kinase-like predicted kinase
MNPSTAQILEAVERVPADKVIILPNNKNIFLAARQAAEVCQKKPWCCLPARFPRV